LIGALQRALEQAENVRQAEAAKAEAARRAEAEQQAEAVRQAEAAQRAEAMQQAEAEERRNREEKAEARRKADDERRSAEAEAERRAQQQLRAPQAERRREAERHVAEANGASDSREDKQSKRPTLVALPRRAWLAGGGAVGVAVVTALIWMLVPALHSERGQPTIVAQTPPAPQPTTSVPQPSPAPQPTTVAQTLPDPLPAPSVPQPLPAAQPAPAPQAPILAPQQAPANISAAAVPLSPDRERTLKTGEAFSECDKCPEMIVVPAGSFTMGSPPSENDRRPSEGPQHKVAIGKRFAVSKFELAFDQWDACVTDGGCNGYRPNDAGWGRGRRPVINVSWNDVQQYVAWLAKKTGRSYRLLTEAEWEYAARAGTTTAYYWGDDIGKGNANCNGCGSQWDNKQTAPVGSFAPNVFGLYDMAGNVWQWVEDCWHDNYNGAPSDGLAVLTTTECDRRVIRGGAWFNGPGGLRAAIRFGDRTSFRIDSIGFRVGRTLTP
jgi:formylglycine-generating enzyme required for sulfatase activity